MVMLLKNTRFKSKKLLNAARGESCVHCGIDDETIVACHIPWKDSGTGQKTHDFMCAHLCHDCHADLDGKWRSAADHRLVILRKTLARLFANGTIGVN